MRLYLFCICLYLAIIAAPSPVYAAAITNLSDVPQTISLIGWNTHNALTIPPGKTLRIPGRISFYYHDRMMRIEADEEYTIWKDGSMGIQRYLNRHSRFPF